MPFRVSERPHPQIQKEGFFEAFLAQFSVLPFRCDRCDYRFFRNAAKLKSRTGSSTSADPFSALQTPPETLTVSLPR